MDLSSKLSAIYNEKLKNKSLFDDCGFSDTNMISTYSQNLSNIILSSSYYNSLIDNNWPYDILWIDGIKIRKNQHQKQNYPLYPEYKETLTRVDIDKNCLRIGNNGLQSFNKLTDVSGKNIKNIQNFAFQECPNLSSVYFPSAEKVYEQIFMKCPKLSTMTLDEDMSHIVMLTPNNEISNCGNVLIYDNSIYWASQPMTTKVITDYSIWRFKMYAFRDCKSLIEVSCPQVSSIGNMCFDQCQNLSNVYIDGVQNIGYGAFASCNKLEYLSSANDNMIFLNEENELSNRGIVLINGNNVIWGSIKKCRNILLPDNIEKVMNWSFKSCENLESVSCGSNVNEFCAFSFYSCNKLKKINLDHVDSPIVIQSTTFANSNYPISVYVKNDLVDTWKEQTNWSTLVQQNKVKIIGSEEI